MQWLNVSYSIWFNRRHRRSGHLFQGRFKSVIVSPEQWGLALSRYLHLNPVRVGPLRLGKAHRQQQRQGANQKPARQRVEQRIARLRSYRWSYRSYIGLEPTPEWLERKGVLRLGGGPKGQWAERYREYVEAAAREGLEESPWDQLQEQAVLGGEDFLEKIRGQVAGDDREQRGARRLAGRRPALEEVIRCVEQIWGEKWEACRERRGDRGRDLVLYVGRTVCGLKLVELARVVGMKEYGTVAMAVKRYAGHLRVGAGTQKELRHEIRNSCFLI